MINYIYDSTAQFVRSTYAQAIGFTQPEIVRLSLGVASLGYFYSMYTAGRQTEVVALAFFGFCLGMTEKNLNPNQPLYYLSFDPEHLSRLSTANLQVLLSAAAGINALYWRTTGYPYVVPNLAISIQAGATIARLIGLRLHHPRGDATA